MKTNKQVKKQVKLSVEIAALPIVQLNEKEMSNVSGSGVMAGD